MCNFAAQLKHVAYREELIEIQRDNTFRRETLKPSKKARYKPNYQSANFQVFKPHENFNSLFLTKKTLFYFSTVQKTHFRERQRRKVDYLSRIGIPILKTVLEGEIQSLAFLEL